MKPKKKSKFNIKSFFVMHVEKIVLILLVPVAVFIAIQGTKYPPLTWQPDDLRRSAEQSNSHIQSREVHAADVDVEIRPYDVQATWIKVGVKDTLYKTDTLWLPSLFPEKIKRGPVPLFTVNDLRARSGMGAVSLNSNNPVFGAGGGVGTMGGGGVAGTNARAGERWAVVTGLIPIRQQLEAYVNAYSTSVLPDPVRDTPQYVLYEVERAEVKPGAGIDALEWTKLDFVRDFRQQRQLRWSGFGFDPVDPTFLTPTPSVVSFPMAYPLPPIDKKFGEEVAHPPTIPMLTDSQIDAMKESEALQKRMYERFQQVEADDILEGTSDLFGGQQQQQQSGMDGSSRRRRGTQEEEDIIKPVLVNDYLFRFMDFNVESGKTYRYRVRLCIYNPNYRLAPNYLLDETLSEERILYTDFSTPSNMVTIPLDSRILATGVVSQAPSRFQDPYGTAMAIYFDMKDGSEWYTDVDRVYRGSTVNLLRRTVTNPALSKTPGQMEMGMGEMGGYPGPASRPPGGGRNTGNPRRPDPNAKKDDEKTLDVISEVCVLDLQGGLMLSKINSAKTRDVMDLRSPSRMIVLEPSGNMVIRNVNADLIEAETIKNPQAAQGGMGMGGMGMGGMGGGMGGGMESF